MSSKQCCVPGCTSCRRDKGSPPILHKFPNPTKELERFRAWLIEIGGDIVGLSDLFIHQNRRVCHQHFEPKYILGNKLTPLAVPTLNLKAPAVKTMKRKVLTAIENIQESRSVIGQKAEETEMAFPSTSQILSSDTSQKDIVSPQRTRKHRAIIRFRTYKNMSNNELLLYKKMKLMKQRLYRLQKKTDNFTLRLKMAMKSNVNPCFRKTMENFSSAAKVFTALQFRESKKKPEGSRFTMQEKLLTLSLYKQSPKSYRFLRKIFVLPSARTLQKLISEIGISAGINKSIFAQLKMKAAKMSDTDKLCTLMFDEISLAANLSYHEKRDLISGLVTNGTESKLEIADHALVFMVRGLVRNYKQVVAYTFCQKTTNSLELKQQIERIIKELQQCGLKIVATVCDQGKTNSSAIRRLVQATKEAYSRKGMELRDYVFEIEDQRVIPIFDAPHLIKGIRNNLLNKDLKFSLNEKTGVAKWSHLELLYKENPGYKGIRLIPKLTEKHVIASKIPKMKVKHATQIFSQVVSANMGYLADKGILPAECQDTADLLLFFDKLFDSTNGSYRKVNKSYGKPYLKAVTPNSEHHKFWSEARKTLSKMVFIDKAGKRVVPPSLTNWIHNLNNYEILLKFIQTEFKVTSLWMRHLNQDPLENFFGCLRSHGYRNTNPSCSNFESSFASLLISNISHHSASSNCEEDFCYGLQSLNVLLSTKDTTLKNIEEIDYNHVYNDNLMVDINVKQSDTRVISSLAYVSGYILSKSKKCVFKNCNECTRNMSSETCENEYIKCREFGRGAGPWLCYPSADLIKCISGMQDIIALILQESCNKYLLKQYIKTVMSIHIDFSFLKCIGHRDRLINFIQNIVIRFFVHTWCKTVNQLLVRKSTQIDPNDKIQCSIEEYLKKKKK